MLLDLTTCDHPLDLGTTRKKKKVSSPGVAYIFPALMNEASYRRTGFQTRVSFLPPYVIAFFQRLVDMYLFCFPNKSSRSVFGIFFHLWLRHQLMNACYPWLPQFLLKKGGGTQTRFPQKNAPNQSMLLFDFRVFFLHLMTGFKAGLIARCTFVHFCQSYKLPPSSQRDSIP